MEELSKIQLEIFDTAKDFRNKTRGPDGPEALT